MDRILWIANVIKDKGRRPFGPSLRDLNLPRRAILKNGEYNILPPKFRWKYLHYIHDIFTGLVDAQWIWTLLVLGIGFTGGWLIFSLIWWLIAYAHNDLHEDHLPAKQAETGWTPCVLNIHGFPSCFLYSLETQHTTGYGLRAITEECPEAIFILCCQCLSGMIIDGFTVGVVVAKMMRPRLANYTIQFSRNAVVALRNGELCMMFRAGDLRKAPLVGASIRAILIHDKRTKEGEVLKYFETDLDVEVDSAGSDLFLVWPITIVHKINKDSPFYRLSAADMLKYKFEIILLLEGTVESTGQGTNAQTSYVSNEILWGYIFETMVTYNTDMLCYEANYDNFEKMLKIDMPMCSAADLEADGSQDADQEQDDDIKSVDDVKDVEEHDKISLELPYTPSRKESDQRIVTEESAKPTSPRLTTTSLEPPPRYSSNIVVRQSPTHQHHSHRTSISQEVPSRRSIADYYPPRKHIVEHNESAYKSRLRKPSTNLYEYIHYRRYENISEEEERSETPPFPVSWV